MPSLVGARVSPLELLAAVIAGRDDLFTYLPGGITLKTGFNFEEDRSRFKGEGKLKRTARLRQYRRTSAGSVGLYYLTLEVGIAQSRNDEDEGVPSHLSMVQCIDWISEFVTGNYSGMGNVHNSKDYITLSENEKWRGVGFSYDPIFSQRPVFTTAFYFSEEEQMDGTNDPVQYEYANVMFDCSYVQ